MTQFIRIRTHDAASNRPNVDEMRSRLESIPGVTSFIDQSGDVFAVDANDGNSAGGLADDIHNRIRHNEPVDSAPLVRLVRLVAESGWLLEAWYSDDDDLPTFCDPDTAIREIVEQATEQPPEVYVRILPTGMSLILTDDEIVVLVKHQNAHQWFVSERDFWVLDQDSWRRAFAEAGYVLDASYAERFGIAVVDESNATGFLQLMEQYAINTDALRAAWTMDGEFAYPSLFVDFDERQIQICGVESPAFEDYLPPGWHAQIGSFLDVVPEELRYWSLSEDE